ncbi:MAG: DsbA family protein [Acidimicrobiia bacterium]|nr:DsbA family protein [Acidimicrobiia bacterium]
MPLVLPGRAPSGTGARRAALGRRRRGALPDLPARPPGIRRARRPPGGPRAQVRPRRLRRHDGAAHRARCRRGSRVPLRPGPAGQHPRRPPRCSRGPASSTRSPARLAEALFRAYFTEGRNVADPDELVAVAAATGLDHDRAGEILAGSEFADAVARDRQAASEHQVTGVPAFLLAGSFLVPGAQDVHTLVTLLTRARDRLAS